MRRTALKLRRWLAARRAGNDAFGHLLSSRLPSASAPFVDTEFVCLDIETTGVDAASAEMLSIGWVLIRQARVEMSTAEACIVRPPGEVGESATVHGLTDTLCEAGENVADVLEHLLEVLRGRVLAVHYAGLDKALLDRLCRRHFGAPLLVPVVDTLALERRARSRRHHLDEQQSLKLSALRSAYHLPHYTQHDALADAIATAELLLAMVAARGTPASVRLRDLLS
ncbi:exonuclease domain-containing protein [Lentisalinibacter orientalis]|uniref:exonuclease domain-containing protein n=1 Tax=Lentisalinibacter orientalis TaxID=2992241 RepID=UPI00386D6A54